MTFLPQFPELTPAMRSVLERMGRAGHAPLYGLPPQQARAAYEAGAGVLEVPRPALARVLGRTCRAEWTRLWTVKGTWWVTVVATVAQQQAAPPSLDALLNNVIDPNQIIGNGYQNIVVTTKDGRTLVGFMEARETTRLTLRDLTGQTTAVATEVLEQAGGKGRYVLNPAHGNDGHLLIYSQDGTAVWLPQVEAFFREVGF